MINFTAVYIRYVKFKSAVSGFMIWKTTLYAEFKFSKLFYFCFSCCKLLTFLYRVARIPTDTLVSPTPTMDPFVRGQ